MCMKMQFRIQLYTKVLNSNCKDYTRIVCFIKIVKAICLPGDDNNPSLADVQSHAVSSTPDWCMFDISLQQSAVIGRTDSTKNVDVISK